MMLRPSRVAGLVAAGLLTAALATIASSIAAPPAQAAAPTGPAMLPISRTGTWLTAADGRVVVLHGVNQVYKVPPYEPSADGFGADDAAFLADNGFTAVRLGVIWAAVEPSPGSYDDTYLDSIAQTVQTLAAEGIVSLLDFHQDLYNELFQGEGAPAWAVQTAGLPNPQLGFPANYFLNPAQMHAWYAFWRNAPGPDGIGLRDHFANAWAHVAGYFAGNQDVFGYEILNEPWPGFLWAPCFNPVLGCPLQDLKLTDFYNQVVAAIRTTDPNTLVFFEPNTLFNQGIHTDLAHVADPLTGFAFHDYCAFESVLHTNFGCSVQDGVTFLNSTFYTHLKQIPGLVTEFGATDNLENIAEVMGKADLHKVGWLYWAYTGNDKTSQSPTAQALVYDPSLPPTGSNVNFPKLKTLAAPYPQVVAGIPKFWLFKQGTFRFSYSTMQPDRQGFFSAGAQTLISVPTIVYPGGYQVTVHGGQVVSAANAPLLIVESDAGAQSVDVVVTP